MGGLYGADVAQLRELARQFDGASQQLSGARSRVGNGIRIAAWVGPFAVRFRATWDSDYSRSVQAASVLLQQTANILRSNADDQDRTSAVDGSAGSAGSASKAPSHNPAPSSAQQMVERLHSMSGNDGILVDKVVGSDGTVRYIVYLNGTNASANPLLFSPVENASAYKGIPGPTDAYIQLYLSKIIQPRDAEVLVIGYSQGGMHGEILAQSGVYNVTDVLTLDSPPIEQHNNLHGANVVRISDVNRESVGELGILGELNNMQNQATGGKRDIVARLTGEGEKGIQTYSLGQSDARYDDGAFRAHDSHEAHAQIAQQFDESHDPLVRKVRDGLSRFYRGTREQSFD